MFHRVLKSLKIGTASALMVSLPTTAAEFVSVSYGAFQRSLPVTSLSEYAQTGVADAEIKAYIRYLKPDQREQLRQTLRITVPLDVVAVSQFLYTYQGEVLLERIGDVIRANSTETGFYAIRGAMISAAADPAGLSFINILRKFPTREVHIDLGEGFNLLTGMNGLVNQTQAFTLEAVRETAQNALLKPLPKSRLVDIQRSGAMRVTRMSFNLPKTGYKRAIPFDLLLPSLQSKSLQPAPLLVISHGFGSDRTSFRYLAEHLSSYGFAVAVPEHPGSNAQQVQNWLQGRTALATEPAEFIKRPLDIHYLLDALTERAKTDAALTNRINFDQIGIIGQSFGGYTALALAGAPIDRKNLQANCQNERETLNLSLLLQCRALEVSKTPPLVDPRIKAILTINPISSAIFGEKSLQNIRVPTLMVGGSSDSVAPALYEQVYPFSWLTTPQKYLVLIQNSTHFSAIGTGATSASEGFPIPSSVVGMNPEVTQRYLKMLSVAFFKTHLQHQSSYQVYLSDAYLYRASQVPFRLSVLRQVTPEMLAEAKIKP
jgi:predicted dienelactone hydrolase